MQVIVKSDICTTWILVNKVSFKLTASYLKTNVCILKIDNFQSCVQNLSYRLQVILKPKYILNGNE